MVLLLSIALIASTRSVQGSTLAEREAIRQAVAARHGAQTRLSSILAIVPYALTMGTAGETSVHDGLQLSKGSWRIVCELAPGPANAKAVEEQCKFPHDVAEQLAADEAANAAAAQGAFSTAVTMEKEAYKLSTPQMRPSEAARLQLLTQLERQMELGQIDRTHAIIQWNSFRLSTFLP